MRKIYSLLLFLAVCGGVNAQSIERLNVPIYNDLHTSGSSGNALAKTTTCSQDTVQYPLAKAVGLSALSINNATSAQGMSQYYNAPQAITISGIEFYAYKINTTGGISINVTAAIYLAGSDSMPTGMPLATTTVAVDTNFGGGNLSVLKKVASFNIPVTMSAPYVVVLSNNSPNGVGMIFNDYNTFDGAQEWLSSADIGGTWIRSYNVNVGGAPFDADLLAHPIVTYDVTADFTVGNQCFGSGSTVTFTNASSPILLDRMYNQAVFLGLTPLSFTYNFGDGSAAVNAIDTFNVYSNTTNLYTATLTDTIYGWTSNCFDQHTEIIGDSLVADWWYSQSGSTVNFNDISSAGSGVASLLWDFGDGNTSTAGLGGMVSHTYAAAGTYTVCMIATSNCGSADSTCQSVTVVACGSPTAGFTFAGSNGVYNFTNTSVAVVGASFMWDLGDGNSSNLVNPSHTYTASGQYTVTMVVTDSCGADTISQIINVCLDPIANFSITNNNPSYDFTNTSTSASGATYSWDMGDGTTFTTMDASHTYTANGTYSVVLTITDSCGTSTITQTVDVTTIGLNQLSEDRVSIYPNPANEQFKVEADMPLESVTIYDMNGREVYTQTVTSSAVLVIYTSTWAQGHYTVEALLTDGLAIHKRMTIVQ